MSFSKMLEILQQRNKGKIVLIKLGVFYIATGRDAVLLHCKLNLKCTCYKENSCKVGIPVNSIEIYLKKLDKLKYSYIVYDYCKATKRLEEKYQREGKINKITGENINCLICKGTNKYKEDEYLQAIAKLYGEKEE